MLSMARRWRSTGAQGRRRPRRRRPSAGGAGEGAAGFLSTRDRWSQGGNMANIRQTHGKIWQTYGNVEKIYGQPKIFRGKNLANMTCLTCFLMLFDRFKSMIVGGSCVPLIDNFEQNIQASYHLHIHIVYTCVYIYRL